MVQQPNSIDLKTEQVCLKKNIELAENTLKHTLKQIEELSIGAPELRGHDNNMKIQQLIVTKIRLENAIETMLFDEKNTDHFHIDTPEPLEIIQPKANPDGAYSI